MTVDEARNGRQAIPMRGSKPRLSGYTSEPGYFWPVSEPIGLALTTGASAAKPEAMSRFTRRPYSSVIGEPYSQPIPSLTVSAGLRRQSSASEASQDEEREY